MVSLGTVIAVIGGGAILAGGYAVLSNLDKVGSALSRGVEGHITNPLGIALDNAFSNFATSGQSPTVPSPSVIAGQTVPSVNNSTITIPASTIVHPTGIVTSNTPPLLNLSPTEKVSASAALAANREKTKQQNAAFEKTLAPKAGYYYLNYTGSKYDSQILRTAAQAADLIKVAAAPGDALLNVRYLGKSKLSTPGFNLFGKSQNYL